MKFASALIMALIPLAASAQSVRVEGAYALQNNPASKSGAAFMRIDNGSDVDVSVIGAQSDIAKITEIHEHAMEGDVMKMTEVKDGISIPAEGCVLFERGGYHIMMMGLSSPFESGEAVHIDLEFSDGERLSIEAPVMSAEEAEHHSAEEDQNCIRAETAPMMDHQ